MLNGLARSRDRTLSSVYALHMLSRYVPGLLYGLPAARLGVGCFPFVALQYHVRDALSITNLRNSVENAKFVEYQQTRT